MLLIEEPSLGLCLCLCLCQRLCLCLCLCLRLGVGRRGCHEKRALRPRLAARQAGEKPGIDLSRYPILRRLAIKA